jgi:hypothetical protein
MPSSSDSDDDDDALDDLNGAFEVLEYTLPDRAELEIVTPMIEKELETMHKSEVQVSFVRPRVQISYCSTSNCSQEACPPPTTKKVRYRSAWRCESDFVSGTVLP